MHGGEGRYDRDVAGRLSLERGMRPIIPNERVYRPTSERRRVPVCGDRVGAIMTSGAVVGEWPKGRSIRRSA